MKKYISMILVLAVALLFVGQRDGLAKTQKQATAELSKVDDGEVYYQAKAPKAYKLKSVEDQATAPRFGKWFEAEIDELHKRVERFWQRLWLPVKERNFKSIEAVE